MARTREWLRRYGPAELLALAGALAGFLAVDAATGNHAAAAFGAAAGDNLAYYGALLARELRGRIALARRPSERLRAVAGSLRALACEFGPAEALDSTVVRPACTTIATSVLGPGAGVVVAKVVADLAFYAPVIATYELRRLHTERPLPAEASSRER